MSCTYGMVFSLCRNKEPVVGPKSGARARLWFYPGNFGHSMGYHLEFFVPNTLQSFSRVEIGTIGQLFRIILSELNI